MAEKAKIRGGLERELQYRDPNKLKPHPDNPRGDIDPSDPEIAQLAADIARRNVIEPLVITPDGTILAGHRRRVASIVAGLSEVPVVIRELQKHEFAEEFFISENMQRQNLSALEEARAISNLRDKLSEEWDRKVTLMDLARRLDMPVNTVSLRLYILQLPERVQKLFHLAEVPVMASRQLARLAKYPEEVEAFADRMVTRHISLASLEALVTRRLDALNADPNEDNYVPRGRTQTRYKPHETGIQVPPVTRDVAVENLNQKLSGNITVFKIKALLDSVCCSCGMLGNSEVCISCPLPRFVNGIAGRATTGKDQDDE